MNFANTCQIWSLVKMRCTVDNLIPLFVTIIHKFLANQSPVPNDNKEHVQFLEAT